MFGEAPKFCDVTGEVIDEAGLVRFYRCTREPRHGGAWHVGVQFGPNYVVDTSKPPSPMQMWPVNPARQDADS